MSSSIKLDQLNFPKASPQAASLLAYLSNESEDQGPDLIEVNELIMQDPVLAGTLLRYANSPLYRRATEISNVPDATRLIGLKNVRSAVVMTVLHAADTDKNEITKAVRQHSLVIAALSKSIARKSCAGSADDLELVGLIHDIGMLVLATNFEDEYAALLERARSENVPIDRLETDTFGFNHDQIAVRALHEFRLPTRHENVLTHFHQAPPEGVLDDALIKECAVLVLAHQLALLVHEESYFDESLFEPREQLLAILNLDETAVQQVLEETLAQLSDFAG